MTTAVYIREMSSPRRYYLVIQQGIMQNKPNFLNTKMFISQVITKRYGNFSLLGRRQNKPNSNPIKAKQTQFYQHSQPLNQAANCGSLKMIMVL